MIGRIGVWACVSGVIKFISTCKTIVQIVRVFNFFGLGLLHVYCSFASSLAACSVATPAEHGLLWMVWGGLVLICYIGRVAERYRLASSPLGSVADPLSWALSLMLKLCLSCPLVLGRGWDVGGGWNTI